MARRENIIARRYLVRGLVQGVGYRAFAIRHGQALGLTGYAKNLSDGSVEVYAQGPAEKVRDLAGYLHRGPMLADVRGVDESEAPLLQSEGFSVRH